MQAEVSQLESYEAESFEAIGKVGKAVLAISK